MDGFNVFEDYGHIIDGHKTRSPTSALTAVLNPATETPIAHVPSATRADLDAAVAGAARAFPRWGATAWGARQAALRGLADLLEQHAAAFAELLVREVGKDRASAAFELAISVPWIRAVAEQTLEDEVVQDEGGKLIKTRFRPFGVCAGITPFNFPLTLTITKLGQAVLAGNCIIIKAPPTTPCVVSKFVELAQAVFPPGVVSVLLGGSDLGQWIVQHPRIMRISMTGSVPTGKAVMAEAASELKSLTLELGGNDPAIVLDDVDPVEIAQRVFLGATHNAGQTCFQMKRIYLHANIYDAVKYELVKLARAAKVGNPSEAGVTVGPVQNKSQYDRLRGLLAECEAKGYQIAYKSAVPPGQKGYFIPLVILDNPPDDARVVREEQFGPFVPLLKWSDDEDVVRRANDTEFGFSASIWGHDMQRCQNIADKLYNGMVWINDWGTVGGALPMAGVKHSGVGVENAKHGLSSWTYIQSFVSVDRAAKL